MTTPVEADEHCPLVRPDNPRLKDCDYCLASGLRRKFLDFCDENPGAEECRVYDV